MKQIQNYQDVKMLKLKKTFRRLGTLSKIYSGRDS